MVEKLTLLEAATSVLTALGTVKELRGSIFATHKFSPFSVCKLAPVKLANGLLNKIALSMAGNLQQAKSQVRILMT